MPDGGVIRIAVSKSDYTFVAPIQCGICGEAIAGEWNRVDIADDGAGIPPSSANRIFEPYFSGSPDRKSGLGLTQVAGTVKRYGGHISVDSTPEIGTTFSLYLRGAARRE